MSRLIIGNLAAEIELARMVTPGPHPDVRPKVAERIAIAGNHLTVFARPGDRLWLPAELPPSCPRAPDVEYLSGPLDAVEPAAAVLAWAEIPAVARLRADTGSPADAQTWTDQLFQLHPTASVCARVNHRGFAFALAESHSWPLPGACWVTSIGDVERALRASGRVSDGWIVKAPLAAAGRERLQQRGTSLTAEACRRVERLLARYGQLLFEPWVERLRDLACIGIAEPSRIVTFPCHSLVSDERGIFRAAIIDDELADDTAGRAVRRAAERAGQALAEAGYLGPYSVDAFLWRHDRTGAVRLQPMSEINARMTFGLIARAQAMPGRRYRLSLTEEVPPSPWLDNRPTTARE